MSGYHNSRKIPYFFLKNDPEALQVVSIKVRFFGQNLGNR